MNKEYHFTYKDYYISITHYLTGIVCASIRNDDDYFTKKYIDYTRAEIIDKVKQLINERTKQWKLMLFKQRTILE
jgi:hypothetical protein